MANNSPQKFDQKTLDRNDQAEKTLLEMEKIIQQAQYPDEPAANQFKEALKAKILKKRQEKNSMPNVISPLINFFKLKRLMPIIAVIVLIAVVLTTIHFWPSQPLELDKNDSPFSQFSKLLINPAYAKDNFEVQATKSDSLGVDNNTTFIIKSKDKINLDLLKNNLALEPAIDFKLEKINDFEFEVVPEKTLQEKKVYNIKIASAYLDENNLTVERDYSWAFQIKNQFKVLNTLPGHKATYVPLDTGIEITFSHDNFVNYESAITFNPWLAGKFEKHKRTVVFVPKELKNGTIYTVTISKDLELLNSDMRLKDDYHFSFETSPTGDRRAENWSFGWAQSDDFNSFASDQEPAFAIYAHNLYELPGEKFILNIYSFVGQEAFIQALKKRHEIPWWARVNQENYRYDHSTLSSVASFTLSPVQYGYSKYLVLPQTLPQGYYIAETDVKGKIFSLPFQVNDLAVYSSVTKTDTLVWVHDLQTKTPLNNARVTIIDQNLEQITDQDGLATFSTASFYNFNTNKEPANFYLTITNQEATGAYPLNINYQEEQNIGDNYWHYFYTDRPMYQSNDTIKFWGFLKARNNERIQEQLKIKLTGYDYLDYYYEPIALSETAVNLDQSSSFTGNLNLVNVSPGFYELSLFSGEKVIVRRYLQIQSYIKPSYKIEVAADKKAIFAGDTFKADLTAKFFEGTPVAKLDLNYDYAYNNNQYNPDTISGASQTDELGQTKINFQTVYRSCESVYCYYPQYTTLNVAPVKAEEGEITGQTTVLVFGPHVQATTQFEQINESRAKITTKVTKVDLDKINNNEELFYYYNDQAKAEPAPGIKLTGQLKEITYKKTETGEYYDFVNKIVRKTYDYETVMIPLATYEGVTNENGEFIYELPIGLHKNYEVNITVADAGGRKEINHAYLYTFEPGSYNTDSYQLKTLATDQSYSLGETVKMQFVKNDKPLPSGQKNFLYYKLKQGLIGKEISSEANYNFTFTDQYLPDIYVKGIWFDGRNYHESNSSWWWGGSGTLVSFKNDDRQLKIEIKKNQEKYEPKQEVQLNLKVTDKNNQPIAAHLNLNLVDESFYQLIEETVNPLGELYRSVDSGEVFSYQSHLVPELSAKAEGGGCFLAGTKITLADGSLKNIEDIKKGDQILTLENPLTKKLVPGEVIQTFTHLVPEYLIINDNLRVTPVHRVFLNYGWQMIGEAKVGDYLMNSAGQPVRIKKIEKVRQTVQVYNFRTEPYRTYLANGFYVHNSKDGVRENFVDTALFATIQSDTNGEATISFKLPDNLTAWRVTAQAISENLYAGAATAPIRVSLPVFVTATYAHDYLTTDQPIIKMRAYGDQLETGDKLTFTVDAPTLGLNKSTQEGEAYTAVYQNIPQLMAGSHKISTKAAFAENDDTLIQSIKVSPSRLTIGQQKFYELKDGLKIEGGTDSRTKLVFSDKNQGQFYNRILDLGWTSGDRIDQKLARSLGNELLKEYFNQESYNEEKMNGQLYQAENGGITLLPYSEADFELSAKIAAIASKYFDKRRLADYFYDVVNSKDSNQEEVGVALFGLASLEEPVLLPIQKYASLPDLTTKEKLYIALAAQKLGDSELARGLYLNVINQSAEEFTPYVRLNVGEDQDDILTVTSLAAALAGGLNDSHREALWQYVKDNYTKEILIYLEELFYMTETLPNLRPGAVSFTVITDGKEINQQLSLGQTYELNVTPQELANIQFKNISGAAGLIAIYEAMAREQKMTSSPDISISREYYVNGTKTNAFKEDDLVEIRLKPFFSQKAPDDTYQIIDLLPSGLQIITKTYSRGLDYSCSFRYPYEINGQKIKFIWSKGSERHCGPDFSYYARVVNPGAYTAEPAVMQAMRSASIINYSEASQVIIKK